MANHPNPKNEPIYFLPSGDEIMENWIQPFQLFSKPENNTLVIDVQPELVDNLEVSTVQEFVMVLQHYPNLIDKFLFSIKLNFPQITDSQLYFPEQEWKTNPKYFRWFHRLSTFGVVLFFLHDSESRYFFIAGDLLADGELEFQSSPGSKSSFVEVGGENMQLICDRVFTSCWLFMLYSHATVFNPKQAIESIIADFKVPFTYSEVSNKYHQDIKTGIYLHLKK